MADDVVKGINIAFRETGASQLINSMTKVDQKYDALIQKIDEAARAGKISGAAREAGSKAVVREMDREIASQVKLASVTGNAEKASKNYRNIQTSVTQAIKDGESIRARELSQLKAQIQAREELAKTLGGRNYLNASTSIDAAIEARQKESQDFSRSLYSRLNEEANRASQSSLPRLRYALYDVSTTATVAGASLLALGTAVAGTSIKMDRQFADVIRTTGVYLEGSSVSANELRESFNALFASMPSSWSDLTEIGTLAGQLGVASENVAEFTKLVTMFASTTDVSVEQAATAFGRLAELLDVNSSEYENLGSSILSVGVASVATESQIINTTSQLASMGSYAGFSADEVIGLSSAMASLGTQPELSRGVITRLFVNISNAIADGGERLEAFGQTAGMTGREFADAWGTDAAGAFQSLISGLGQVEDQGGNSVRVLQDMGITAARDIPTILRLAQNHELLAEQMKIARDGYADGTSLQEQYGIVATTVAEKLTVLKNNAQLFVAELGESANALGPVIDLLTKFVQVATSLIDNPVTGVVTALVLGLSAITGALLLATGAMARFGASAAALRTARTELERMAVDLGIVATEAEAASMRFNKLSASVMGAATSTRSLTWAMRGLKIATGIGAALIALDIAFEVFSRNASKNTFDLTQNIEGLQTALAGDTKNAVDEVSDSFQTLTYYTNETGESLTEGEVASIRFQEMLQNLRQDSDDVTSSIKEQTIAVGQLTKEWLLNELTTGEFAEKFQDIWPQVQGLIQNSGLDLSEILNEALSGKDVDLSGLEQSLNEQLDAIRARQEARRQQLQDELILERGGPVSDVELGQAAGDDETLNRLGEQTRSLMEQKEAVAALDSFFAQFNVTLADTAEKMAINSYLSEALGIELDGAGDGAGEFGNKIEDVVSAILEMQNQMLDTESALATLGKGLAEGGDNWSQFSEAGRTNLANLSKVMQALAKEYTDPRDLANAYNDLFNVLTRAGYSASQLGILRQAIVELGGATGPSYRNFSSFFTGFNAGAEKAKKSAGSVAKKVRTLSDYVSDLSKVMGEAFDFRFGFQTSLDKTITSFRDISDSFDEARQKVRDLTQAIQDYQAEISGIQADTNILQYFLGIAEEYDDDLRVAAIRAELEEQNAKLAKTQNQLSDAQSDYSKALQKATPDLESNTEGSIEQRKAVLDLIDAYKDQIAEYANTGASQQQVSLYASQLKARFEDQMRTLGYAESSVRRYSAAFDDFRTVIERIPRNLTISVNADPALRAIDEFNAAMRSARASAETPVSMTVDYGKIARGAKLAAEMHALQVSLSLTTNPTTVAGYIGRINQIAALISSGNYWDGGFTGRGGKYDIAGAVHKGEYVIPAKDVNQSTGLPYADALNRLSRGSATPSSSYAGGGFVSSGVGVVELGPSTLQALQNMNNVTLVLDGKALASSVNHQNSLSTTRGGY